MKREVPINTSVDRRYINTIDTVAVTSMAGNQRVRARLRSARPNTTEKRRKVGGRRDWPIVDVLAP